MCKTAPKKLRSQMADTASAAFSDIMTLSAFRKDADFRDPEAARIAFNSALQALRLLCDFLDKEKK